MADEKPVLAITADDAFLHVGKPAVLLDHLGVEFADAPPPVWEFFDGTGRRLELIRDGGVVTGFQPAAGSPVPTELDRALLVDRIEAFQARIQVLLTRSLMKAAAVGEPVERRDRVPRLTGELPDVLDALDALAGGPPEGNGPHSGSWLHNAWHRLVGQ